MSPGIHNEHPPNAELSDWIAGQFPPGYPGYAVDVGASDGISINSTYTLEHGHGWRVLCIEPNPQFHAKLREYRKLVQTCACDGTPSEDAEFKIHQDYAEAYSSLRPSTNHEKWKPSATALWETIRVHVRSLEQCLAEAAFTRLDALCVDTEGTELDVLKGIDLDKWRPKVLVVECWDERGDHIDYLEALRYRRVQRMEPVNDLFLREDG